MGFAESPKLAGRPSLRLSTAGERGAHPALTARRDSLALAQHGRAALSLCSRWCTGNAPAAGPGGNTGRHTQTPLPGEPQCLQGVLGHSVGFRLHQHIIGAGSIHDGVVLHDTVHAN